jgi:hypothetical protein
MLSNWHPYVYWYYIFITKVKPMLIKAKIKLN